MNRSDYVGSDLTSIPWELLKVGDEVSHTTTIGKKYVTGVIVRLIELPGPARIKDIAITWDGYGKQVHNYIHGQSYTVIIWFGPLIAEEIE